MKTHNIFFVFLLAFTFNLNVYAGLFDDIEAVHMTIVAPFERLLVDRVSPRIPLPPGQVETVVQGTIHVRNANGSTQTLHPKVKLRGNSSQDVFECMVPKFKLIFSSSETAGTIFQGHKEVNIGTHCDSRGGYSKLGRLWDGKTPHREVLVYEMLKTIDIPTYQARRAWVSYIEEATGEQFEGGVHQAMLLEDMSSLLKRIGATEVKTPYQSVAQSPGVTMDEVALIYFAEALVGNWDWNLKVDGGAGRPSSLFWNMKMIQRSSNDWIIFPYDFDLTDIVTLKNRGTRKFNVIPALFSHDVRNRIASDLRASERLLRSLGNNLQHDPQGQAIYNDHLNRFYQNLPRYTR